MVVTRPLLQTRPSEPRQPFLAGDRGRSLRTTAVQLPEGEFLAARRLGPASPIAGRRQPLQLEYFSRKTNSVSAMFVRSATDFSVSKLWAARVLIVSLLAIALTGPDQSFAADDKPVSAGPALDVQPLAPGEHHLLNHRRLLFATSRKIAADAESAARSRPGGSIHYERVFRATLSPSIAYGWVEVGYPSDREFGAQNYNPDPNNPNPFSYFSIEAYETVGSRQEARELAKKQGFDLGARALVYVHGIDNSFSDGAERLTQLVVDLNVKGTPVLFSWPSETGVPVVRLSPESYRSALANARTSEPYLAQAVDDLLASQRQRFDLLAHSMGTLVVFDVLASQPSSGARSGNEAETAGSTLPNVVLAAPDIGMRHFKDARDEFVRKTQRLTIYCGRDGALYFSRIVNDDDRLGYCPDGKRKDDLPKDVEFVRVYGNYRDPFRHSYYINAPQVLTDIKRALSSERDRTDPDRQLYREIFLD
jgi:esterase/lipase superfamily enzyme